MEVWLGLGWSMPQIATISIMEFGWGWAESGLRLTQSHLPSKTLNHETFSQFRTYLKSTVLNLFSAPNKTFAKWSHFFSSVLYIRKLWNFGSFKDLSRNFLFRTNWFNLVSNFSQIFHKFLRKSHPDFEKMARIAKPHLKTPEKSQ